MDSSPALSPEGLRPDGRRQFECRRVSCRLGGLPGDGSALFSLGNTHVLCSVFGPREALRGGRSSSSLHASVVAEVNVAPFASSERKTVPRRRDRHAAETVLMLERVLASVVETHRFPGSEIRLVLTVLQADGGMRVAALNAASLALAHAGVPMRDLLVACAAGYRSETVLVDPSLRERGPGGVDLPVAVLPSSRRIVYSQLDSRLPLDRFPAVVTAAVDGALAIAPVMRAALLEHMAVLADGVSRASEEEQRAALLASSSKAATATAH